MSDSAFLFDSNVWVALTFDAHPAHRTASEALSRATDRRPAAFCRATQQSYLRLASTPAILRVYGATGLTNRDVLKTHGAFLALPTVTFRDEPADVVPLWSDLAGLPSASPKVWMDAYLAAFAIAGRMTMVTIDRDFRSFTTAGLTLDLLEVP